MITDENESRKDWMIFRFQYHAKYNSRIQDHKVWQDGYHGIACDNIQILSQKLDYIHNKPIRAGIVTSPEHYLYSSAANYAGEKGLIDIIFIDTGFV